MPDTAESPSSSSSSPPPPARLTPLRIAANLVGFAVGVGLLVWCLTLAWEAEDGTTPWDHFREAEWWMIAGMIAATLISLTVNAATFLIALRPAGDVGFWNMQRLNVACNALNYLPLRPGMISRIAYHLRVDRVGVINLGACFGAVALILLLVAAVLGLASLIRPQFDLVWLGIALAGLLVAATFVMVLARLPLAAKHGRGFDRLLAAHDMIWPLIGLRIVDIAAYTARLWCAMAIVGIAVDSLAYVMFIGIVALLFGLFPIRIGFREAGLAAALAFAAGWFGQPEVDQGTLNQLALIESAGEAIVYIPIGALFLPWLIGKLRRGGIETRRRGDAEGE